MVERTLDREPDLSDRYTRLVLERFHAMLASPEFSRIRRKWQRHLGRRKPFAKIETWARREIAWQKDDPESRDVLRRDVNALSESFGVAHWHVLWALFVSGYDPLGSAGSMFPLDVWHPRSLILVTAPEPGLIENLQALAAGTGMLIGMLSAVASEEPRHGRGGLEGLLLEVNLPLEFPQDRAVLAVRRTLRAGKDIIRNAGVQLPLRVRNGSSGDKIDACLVVCPGDDSVLAELKAACAAHGLRIRIDTSREFSDETGDHGWTPLANVRMEVHFAPDVGAETLVRFVKGAIKSARLAMKAVGLNLGQRLRPSPLVELSQELRVDGTRLPRRGLGDIADEQLGTSPSVEGQLTPEGRKAKGQAKSRRNQIKDRLVKKSLPV